MTQSSVEEPEDGTGRVVSLPVIRRGGTVGVVSVHWEATLGGMGPTVFISKTRDVVVDSFHQPFGQNIIALLRTMLDCFS